MEFLLSSHQQKHSKHTIKKKVIKRSTPKHLKVIGFGLNALSFFNTSLAAKSLTQLWFSTNSSSNKFWVKRFWQSADHCIELYQSKLISHAYIWGEGPLVVCQHGWNGSGTQFRHLIPELVNAGYSVIAFDSPAHGYNEGNSTTIMEFSDKLLAIENTVGPIDTVIAHSFGAMAALHAKRLGLETKRMILVNPGIELSSVFNALNNNLSIRKTLQKSFKEHAGKAMQSLLNGENPWTYFSLNRLLMNKKIPGLLIYDLNDEMLPQSQYQTINREWTTKDATIKTQNLGHNNPLKDKQTRSKIIKYLTEHSR